MALADRYFKEEVLVPNCVYRNGLCTEFKPCGAAEALMKKYKEQFKYPERFSKEVGGNIVAEPFKPKSKDYER